MALLVELYPLGRWSSDEMVPENIAIYQRGDHLSRIGTALDSAF